MKAAFRWWCLVVVVGLVIACGSFSDEQSRRGGGLEIPNGVQASVTVRVTDSAGRALRNLPVQLVAGESWAQRVQAGTSVVLDTFVTDSHGVVRLEVTESRVFLLARYGNQGVHMALHPRDSAGYDRANPMPIPMRSLGRLSLKAVQNQELTVFGTPWRLVEQLSSGLYELDSVPQGDYMPVGVESVGLQMGQTIVTNKFDTLTDASAMVFSDPDNLRLTNFENRRLQAIWDPMHVGGYWWTTATAGGLETWDHLGIQRLSDLLDSAEGNVFASVDVQFLEPTDAVANFGLDFSTQPVNTNLSLASSVSFMARGAGDWVFYVQTQDSSGGNVLRWARAILVTDTWQKFQLPLNGFVCETDSTQVWKGATRLGTNLFWQTNTNGNIQVDDLVLEGLEFKDWVDP